MPLQEVVQLLQAAIEASVYIAPTEPGLTATELYEIGKRTGLKEGEIGDAMPQVQGSILVGATDGCSLMNIIGRCLGS